MKLEYIAQNDKGEKIKCYAYGDYTCNNTDRLNARHWIINHLDISEGWFYKSTGKFQHEQAGEIISEITNK